MDEKFEKALELARREFSFPINQKAELNTEALSDNPFPFFSYFSFSPHAISETKVKLVDAILVGDWEKAEQFYFQAIAENIVDSENYWGDEDHTLETIASNLGKYTDEFGHNKIPA